MMISSKVNEEVPLQLSEDDIACCVCYVPYNNEKQFPLKICTNKHVVCNKCLWAMFIEPGVEFSCPFCKEIIQKKSRCIIHPNNIKKHQENMAKSRAISDKSSIKEVANKIEGLSLHERPKIDPEMKFEKADVKPVEQPEMIKPAKSFESEKKVVIRSTGEKKPGQALPAVIIQSRPENNQPTKIEQPRAHSQSFRIEAKPSVRTTNVTASQNKTVEGKKEELSGGKNNVSVSFTHEKKEHKPY